MKYDIKLALTFDETKYYKVDDAIKVTLKDNRVFIGRIIEVDYRSFKLDCAIDYVSNVVVILCKDVKSIEQITPKTSFKVKSIGWTREVI